MYVVSEKTKKRYDTVEDCIAAEKAYDEAIEAKRKQKEELANVRAERAKEVEEAYKQVVAAKENYNKLLNAFTKDYGSFHMTMHSGDLNPFDLFSFIF